MDSFFGSFGSFAGGSSLQGISTSSNKAVNWLSSFSTSDFSQNLPTVDESILSNDSARLSILGREVSYRRSLPDIKQRTVVLDVSIMKEDWVQGDGLNVNPLSMMAAGVFHHAYVVIGLEGGLCMVIEKNDQGLILSFFGCVRDGKEWRQQINENPIKRNNKKLLQHGEALTGTTVGDVMSWLQRKKDEGYNMLTANCKHFAREFYDKFAKDYSRPLVVSSFVAPITGLFHNE